MTALIASVVALFGGAQASDVGTYVPTGLRDATFIAEIVSGNQAELRKINDDFGKSYRYKTSTVSLKDPLMFRIDSKVEDTNIAYIVNGTTQWFKLGGAHIKVDLSKSPGKRQTAFDVGLLTSSLFDSLFDAKFVSMDAENGAAIFDVNFKQRDIDPSHHRIWIDKEKKFVVKREWYSRTGALRATFTYSEPVQVSGFWFPTRMEVRNADNVLAGVTIYKEIKANPGLPDSLFAAQ